MNFVCFHLPFQDREWLPFAPKTASDGYLAALVATGLLFSAPPTFGFLEFARGELFLNTTAKATYDSNIYARSEGGSDFYASIIPELQFLRQAGRGKIDLRAGVDVTRFLDFTDEDFEDFFADLVVSYPVSADSPLSGGLKAGFAEQSRVDEFLNARVRSEQTLISLSTHYTVSERLGLRNSLGYDHTTIDNFSNIESATAMLGLQWSYSPHLDWFADYRLRRSQSGGEESIGREEVENLDQALFIGATGVLAPRLTGVASLGYQQTNARGAGPSRGLIVTHVVVEWDWRPRTDVTLAVNRDLDVSPSDESVETTGALLTLEHQIDPKIGLRGRLNYRLLDFRGQNSRQDHAFTLGAELAYLLSRYWNAGLSYDFTINDSNRPESDFTRQILQIFTRYSF